MKRTPMGAWSDLKTRGRTRLKVIGLGYSLSREDQAQAGQCGVNHTIDAFTSGYGRAVALAAIHRSELASVGGWVTAQAGGVGI